MLIWNRVWQGRVTFTGTKILVHLDQDHQVEEILGEISRKKIPVLPEIAG